MQVIGMAILHAEKVTLARALPDKAPVSGERAL